MRKEILLSQKEINMMCETKVTTERYASIGCGSPFNWLLVVNFLVDM